MLSKNKDVEKVKKYMQQVLYYLKFLKIINTLKIEILYCKQINKPTNVKNIAV